LLIFLLISLAPAFFGCQKKSERSGGGASAKDCYRVLNDVECRSKNTCTWNMQTNRCAANCATVTDLNECNTLSECMYNTVSRYCQIRTSAGFCDGNTQVQCSQLGSQCYYDTVQNRCLPNTGSGGMQGGTPPANCALYTTYATCNDQYRQPNYCRWDATRNQCLNI